MQVDTYELKIKRLDAVKARIWQLVKNHWLARTPLAVVADGLTIMVAIMVVELIFGCPDMLKLAYVFPVWRATALGNKKTGLVVATVVAVCSTIVAEHSVNPHLGWVVNLFLALGVLYFVVLNVSKDKQRLADATSAANTDALTGVLNRLSIDMLLDESIQNCVSRGQALTVAMIDCDKFKTLNDVHGHRFGDQILRTLVTILDSYLPTNTVIGRVGGDEFLVLMFGHSEQTHEQCLINAEQRFRNATIVMGALATFSYGLARFGEDGTTASALLEAADQDMYVRKAMRSIDTELFGVA